MLNVSNMLKKFILVFHIVTFLYPLLYIANFVVFKIIACALGSLSSVGMHVQLRPDTARSV